MLSQSVYKKQIDREGNADRKIDTRIVNHVVAQKRKKRARLNKEAPETPMTGEFTKTSEKVSFCTSKGRKASLTLETAMVLPLFFLGMLTMISFMDIYRLQTTHLTHLCQNAMQSGMYAYGTEGNGPQELTLPDVYSYQPLGGLLPLRKVWTYNQVKVHTWTGRDASSWNISDTDEVEEMVFVTTSGGVYHLDENCSYLNLSVQKTSGNSVGSLRNHNGEKYHACELCSRNQAPAGTVYITQEGNRYHNRADCSGLKRTVRLVCKSEVEQMGMCSRCGKKHG